MKYRINKPSITEEQSKEIRKLYEAGMSQRDIAIKINRTLFTVKYHTMSEEEKENVLKSKRRSYSSVRRAKNIVYLNTEAGFIISKYHDMKKSCKRKQAREINADKKIELLSQEEFLELWTQHKAKQGITCGYTGEPLLMQRKTPRKDGVKHKTPKNLLSVDCLDPEIGYTKQNIVFCSWGFNDRKNAVKIKDCYLIIKKHEERNKND
jgi:IS30 family transposase